MKATLSINGQITIPRAIRERLRLLPGDVLDFDEQASIIVARRVIDPGEWDRNLASARELWDGGTDSKVRTSQELLDYLRGSVELPPGEDD